YHGALAHTSGKLMRIIIKSCGGLRNANLFENLDCTFAGFFSIDLLVQFDSFDYLLAHCVDGIEGSHGILRYETDSIASNGSHLVFGQTQQVLTLKHDLSG